MASKVAPEPDHRRYYYQIPINMALLVLSIVATLMVQRHEQSIGGGISRPLLFLLINIEIFIAIFLAASIIRQSVILFLERRKERPGSVFKKNLLFSFIFLSIIPGLFIFLGASKLVVKHLDLWFGSRLEQGFSGGITLYEEVTQEIRYRLTRAGEEITQQYPPFSLSSTYQGFETKWWPRNKNTVELGEEPQKWRSFREFNDRGIKELKEEFLELLEDLEKTGRMLDFFGSTYWLKSYPTGILALIYRPPASIRSALIKVQNAHTDYLKVREMKHLLKFNFYLQAVLLLFLVLVLAIWCAFYLARGISTPIQRLLEATLEVRAGNFAIEVPPMGSRDLQTLIISFNEMTKSLASAQDAMVKINTLKTWQEAVKQIAHEIKNPLTPINLTTQRLQRKCLPALSGEEAKILNESCSTILQQVDVIKKLVADFSVFAAPTRLDRQSHQIATVVREALTLFQLGYPGISFQVEAEDALPPLLIDAEKMKRVFVNLITNSIEAFKKVPLATPTLTIKIATDAQHMKISVEDNGPGIDPTIMDKLFLPYISTGKKNMGLGMAIVQEIVSQHGGTIEVHSLPSSGAIFLITLPLAY